MFFAHLSMHFLTEKRVSETVNEHRSELKLLGIDQNGRLTEEAVVCPFVLNTEITMKEYIFSIKNMYQEISGMGVGSRTAVANAFFQVLQVLLTLMKRKKSLLLLWLNSWNASCRIPFLNWEI